MKSIQELNKIRDEYAAKLEVRQREQKTIDSGVKEMEKHLTHVMVCGGTGCHSAAGEKIRQSMMKKVEEEGLQDHIKVVMTGCFGLCEAGPIIVIYPEGTFYSHLELDDVDEIVEEHFVKGRIVERLLYKDSYKDGVIIPFSEIDFYKEQTRVALRNCGLINPEDINEYIALDGYQALAEIITEKTPGDVIDFVKEGNVRGRGGAGFPAGRKWETAYEYEADQKYVICNADEGDPGAFMDRSILEGDPHSVLEAMAICGYAIGADKGYIYVRAEYPIAVKRLKIALDQAKEMGVIGKNILGTDFNFEIELKLGAGAFVCGEGTALIESIEGKRGLPRTKIHRTAHRGLWQKPTIINNVETLAIIPVLFQKGTDWFKEIGTESSPGTKVFALGGKVRNTGLVEVPMGVTLKNIIYDIGGGIPGDKKFKAIQTGGPSGGCIPAEYLDTPVDFESLAELGAMMGSGGMVAMDEDDCMVDIAKFFLEFSVDESCGKCTPCRIGNKRVLEILERITSGQGKIEDLTLLEDLCTVITESSLCGLGQSSTAPVVSSMKYFYDEYREHIVDKKCRAGVCQDLLEFSVLSDCVGCGLCARACPVDAISGEPKRIYIIDQALCTKCGICLDACPVNAIVKE